MEGIESAELEVQHTKYLRKRISDVLSLDKSSKHLRSELESYCDETNQRIPFRLVKKVYEILNEDGEKIYLHELMQGSEVCLPTVKLPPRNPELEARIQKLKAEQSNREYRHMTRNIDRQKDGQLDLNVGQEVKALNRHLVAVFNFLVTVGGAFAFGYKASEYALGPNFFPVQMMTGLIFGTVVFFADLYFLVKYSGD
ncbi:LOW QUALITY PROTEIN: transmembrane protein 199-like [Haliotis rubra]|uniref:LOW QUALITY PROTEIN: transmembrane protein 199-like n=1 Tax=Haliotis rubra TaxID=36100 RepID=UPI001EE615CD|nr:LOW QUALITY PROTEIN: transmembrane protein 199-like [Haliotis rubra]